MAKSTDEREGPSPTSGLKRKRRGDAATENAIRPLKLRPANRPTEQVARAARVKSDPEVPQGARKAGAPSAAPPVPPEIWERFIGIGAKYYFPDGTPAFVDRGVKLTTASENTEVIRSLVSIALARKWNHITVTGSERFRKETWFAAQRVGIEVRGYKATDVEHAQLARSLAERRSPTVVADQNRSEGAAAEGSRSSPSREPRPLVSDRGQASDPERSTVYVGRLLAHGRDTYRHDPREQSSYFVRLKTDDGERDIWGVDLERAMRHSLSSAKIGDQVTVRAVSREAVTVPKPERDVEGNVIGQKAVAAHRNEWIVERTEFLSRREDAARTFRNPRISPQEAVKKHPELQGSYLKLQAVKLGAERDFKNPEDRERLMARARVLIAQSIERGEPLEPVRLRESVAKQPEKRQESKAELQRAR